MMISADTVGEQRLRSWHIKASLRKLVLGSLTFYALCALGPEVVDYLTAQITTPLLLVLVVSTGLAASDLGSIMLILDGLAHLRKALRMKAAPVVVVTDQPPARLKEQ